MSCPTPPRAWLKNDQMKEVNDVALLDGRLLATDEIAGCIWQIDCTSFSLLGCNVGAQYVEVESFAGVPCKSGYKNGPSAKAYFDKPARLAVDQYSKTVYVCDVGNGRIRKIHDGVVTTLAGDDDDVLNPRSILVREDRSVVFLDIDQVLKIYRVSLEGNVAIIAEFSLAIGQDWYAEYENLYNGPQGGLILCDHVTVYEICDGAVSPITSPSDTYYIAGYSSKLNSVYMFGKRKLFRQRLGGNEEKECVCYTEGEYGGYFEGCSRLVNDDDHTVYAFQDPSCIIAIALKPDPCKAFRRRPTPNFVSSYAQLLDNEDLTSPNDIVFEVDARTIRVPRVVLCLRSEYFRRMLLSGFFKESTEGAKRYPVSDFSYDAFRSVLFYLLTGTADATMCKPIVTEVCLAADYYLVTDLRDQCLEYMTQAVTTKSVSEYAKTADLMKSAALKKACVKCFAEHSSDK